MTMWISDQQPNVVILQIGKQRSPRNSTSHQTLHNVKCSSFVLDTLENIQGLWKIVRMDETGL